MFLLIRGSSSLLFTVFNSESGSFLKVEGHIFVPIIPDDNTKHACILPKCP